LLPFIRSRAPPQQLDIWPAAPFPHFLGTYFRIFLGLADNSRAIELE
jgi:hypothetical protein